MNFTEAYDDTSTSIGLASRLGDNQLLKELLDKKHPSNSHDNRGWRPLHEAAHNGHIECVSLLLGADDVEVDALTHEGTTALQLACRNGSYYTEIVQLLLKAGADPNMKNGDSWALPLPTAVANKNMNVVKQLVDTGADVNHEDFSSGLPLHVATEQGLVDVAEFLLESKADINRSDETGRNALHVLMFSQSQNEDIKSMLALLLRKGIDVNAQMKDGTTPLMLAVQRKWKQSVTQLLDNGADVNIPKVDGVLALHFGIEFCSPDIESQPEEVSDDGESEQCIKEPVIMSKILELTDKSLIIPRSADPIKYSLYHLAIEWERFSCLKKLLEANIPPDSFLQETSNAVLDEADAFLFRQVPLVLPLGISVDTPLGFLLSKPFSRERVDAAKLMISKGCAVNAVSPSCLPPLVAAVKHQRNTYSSSDLGSEVLDVLLRSGSDVMYKIRENDILPVSVYVASLFNVAALFKLLQFGVPTTRVFSHPNLQALSQHYKSSSFYTIYRLFPWRTISWLHTINMFVPQLKLDTDMLFDQHRMVDDENLSDAWKNFSKMISTPKSLQQLCVLAVRETVGTASGWPNLAFTLKKLKYGRTSLPPMIMDLLLFNQIQMETLFYCPPRTAMLSYLTPESPSDSEDENNSLESVADEELEVANDDDDDDETEQENSDDTDEDSMAID